MLLSFLVSLPSDLTLHLLSLLIIHSPKSTLTAVNKHDVQSHSLLPVSDSLHRPFRNTPCLSHPCQPPACPPPPLPLLPLLLHLRKFSSPNDFSTKAFSFSSPAISLHIASRSAVLQFPLTAGSDGITSPSSKNFRTMSAGECGHDSCECSGGVFDVPLGTAESLFCLKCEHDASEHENISVDDTGKPLSL
jgi:hypothetical protein